MVERRAGDDAGAADDDGAGAWPADALARDADGRRADGATQTFDDEAWDGGAATAEAARRELARLQRLLPSPKSPCRGSSGTLGRAELYCTATGVVS